MGIKDFLKNAASAAGRVASRIAKSESAQRIAASLAASAFSATDSNTDPGARATFLRAIAAGYDRTAEPVDIFARSIHDDLNRLSKEELNDRTYQKILARHLEDERKHSENFYAKIQDEVKHLADYEEKEGIIFDKFMKRSDNMVRMFDAKLEKAHQALVGVGLRENQDAKKLRDAILKEADNINILSQNDGLHYDEELALIGAEAGYEALASGFSSIPFVGGPLSMAAHAAGKLMEISLNEGFKAKRKNVVPVNFNPHDFDAGEKISDFAKVLDKDYFTQSEKQQQTALFMIDTYRKEIDDWRNKYKRYQEKVEKGIPPPQASREVQHNVEIYDVLESDAVIFLCYHEGMLLEKFVVDKEVKVFKGSLRELFRDYISKYVQTLASDTDFEQFRQAIQVVSRMKVEVEPSALRKVVLSILLHGSPSTARPYPETDISSDMHI